MAKARLDQLLVSRGLADSLEQSRQYIMAGLVFSGTQRLDKAGTPVAEETPLSVKYKEHPWVSRGGLKLAHGLVHFNFDVKNKVAVDVGASSGGFTDVLLQHGAAKVYAVDVGQGQLDWKLRNDPRVVVMENTNARHLTAAQIAEALDVVVCDASFTRLSTVLPAALALTGPRAIVLALIKPQFEVEKEQVEPGGVVTNEVLHEAVCERASNWLSGQGWQVQGTTPSPILGPSGNREFLIGAVKGM